MAKSPFQTVLFHPFVAMLKRAAANGHRIEPPEKQAWNKYIRDHKIPIAGLMVYGQAMSETIRPVIVSGEGADDGLYLYSDDDEVSVRFVSPTAPPAAAPAAAEPAPTEAAPADAAPASPPAEPPAPPPA